MNGAYIASTVCVVFVRTLFILKSYLERMAIYVEYNNDWFAQYIKSKGSYFINSFEFKIIDAHWEL